MANKPTRAQLEAENRMLRRQRIGNSVVSIANNLIKYGALCFCCYYAVFRSIQALSGEETSAVIKMLGDASVNYGLAWLLAILFGGLTVRERALRKTSIERLEKRITEFETEIDPDRTSSRLTVRGDTNPEEAA